MSLLRLPVAGAPGGGGGARGTGWLLHLHGGPSAWGSVRLAAAAGASACGVGCRKFPGLLPSHVQRCSASVFESPSGLVMRKVHTGAEGLEYLIRVNTPFRSRLNRPQARSFWLVTISSRI